jgi:hypothetical protein
LPAASWASATPESAKLTENAFKGNARFGDLLRFSDFHQRRITFSGIIVCGFFTSLNQLGF